MQKIKILLVEDEPIVGMELQETLEREGYVIPQIVQSADEVIESSMRHHPDLIVMDINLKSFIDGIDAARRLRMVSNVPIIYLTAYTNAETRARAERTGPAAFLTKPVDDRLLLSEISSALTGR